MVKLAHERGDDPGKYTKGIGQDEMAIPPITQDTVTMAANAAYELIDETDREKIDYVIFGTETGIDHSKSGAVYVSQLLGLKNEVRAVETKQACYGATVAILMSKDPRIMRLEKETTYQTEDTMDFWRPIYSEEAFVNGQHSNNKYIEFFADLWEAYTKKTGRDFADFEAICFHLPYTRM